MCVRAGAVKKSSYDVVCTRLVQRSCRGNVVCMNAMFRNMDDDDDDDDDDSNDETESSGQRMLLRSPPKNKKRRNKMAKKKTAGGEQERPDWWHGYQYERLRRIVHNDD